MPSDGVTGKQRDNELTAPAVSNSCHTSGHGASSIAQNVMQWNSIKGMKLTPIKLTTAAIIMNYFNGLWLILPLK